MSSLEKCWYCGYTIENDEVFCSRCGHRVNSGDVPSLKSVLRFSLGEKVGF